MGVFSHYTVHLSPLWKPTSLKPRAQDQGMAENTSGWSSADSPLAPLSLGKSLIDLWPHRQGSGVRGGAGTPGPGWAGERIHSVTQVWHTGGDQGLRGLTPPSATSRQGAPTRLRGLRLSAATGTPPGPEVPRRREANSTRLAHPEALPQLTPAGA